MIIKHGNGTLDKYILIKIGTVFFSTKRKCPNSVFKKIIVNILVLSHLFFDSAIVGLKIIVA